MVRHGRAPPGGFGDGFGSGGGPGDGGARGSGRGGLRVTDFYIGGIKTLSERSGWVNEAEARDLLERAATATLPLMAKRGWKVDVLKEFFPRNAGLLGLNASFGKGTSDHRCTISVRCRPAHAGKRGGCYMYRDIIGTLVHELTHIVHSAHDERFYALMDELLNEVDHLGGGVHFVFGAGASRAGRELASGSTAAGAFGGARLPAPGGGGGGPQGNGASASPHGVIPFQGKGRTTAGIAPRGLTPREAAARAAERRLRDQQTCGQGHAADEIIDLTAEEAEEEAVSLSQNHSQKSPVIAAPPAPRQSPRHHAPAPPSPKRQKRERRRRRDGVGTYLAHVPKAGDEVVDLTEDN